MAKSNTTYFCTNCGFESRKWLGQCPSCSEYGTFEEEQKVSGSNKGNRERAKTYKISDVEKIHFDRKSTGFAEIDRVLGEDIANKSNTGLVSGGVALFSGDPGIGKSTVLLQICANLVKSFKNIIYVSAEESIHQVALRANRILDTKKNSLDQIKLVHTENLETIFETIEKEKSEFVVIDSIQTIQTDDVTGAAGGIAQVKACTGKIVNFAKSRNITVIMVGHINKEGTIAGPKVLEHLVDTVIQLEGENNTDLRIVRSLKNRFGAVNEVGILKMDENGLSDVINPSEYFLSNESVPGICKCPILEGNRIIIIEVQALISPTVFSFPKRISEGVSLSRLQLICAILQRYSGISLSDKDVYLSTSGDLKVTDRAIDLAIAIAIYSSYKNKAVNPKSVAFGELSLSGKINKVIASSRRESEAKRMGYGEVFLDSNTRNLREIKKIF
ncbi:MAG TPA: DNA repair protein RadA [Candidatus Dojkabacteria bacterium]|jgi:DNA repair protein RadA/Sms